MENRKLIKIFIPVMLGFFSYANLALAYEVGTHEFLTKEVVEFYNQNFSGNKILDEYKPAIISGANHEDDNPRWMNHFYDPVYNRGLTKIPGNWVSSKDWAHNSDQQISALYNPVLNTTIAGLLAVTNPGELRKTDFTWERAIRDYLRGDKERAFRGLGQILHLIEDASVPDHTRNDPHPAFDQEDFLETGSPYELWTGDFNLDNPDKNLSLRLSNKKPIALDDLDTYFDSLASYSNNNFYSKDTIGGQEYNLPKPDYLFKDRQRIYAFKIDFEFGDYRLFEKIVPDILLKNELEAELRPIVLQDYWDRLSVKAVQHGAGVVDLFFKEIEKAKNNPNFVTEEPKSLLAQVADAMRGLFTNITALFKGEDDLKLVAEISLDKNEKSGEVVAFGDNSVLGGEIPSGSEQNKIDRNNGMNTDNEPVELDRNFVDDQNEDAAEAANRKNEEVATTTAVVTKNNTSVSEKPVTAPVKNCSFATDKTPSHQKLLINEVAWMGGFSSANDEWTELKNISGDDLDISSWQLLDKDEQIKIVFPGGAKLSSGGFMLLERTNDDSVSGLAANLIYAGALSNANEGLRLFDPDCNLVDEVLAASDWPSGDAAARKTMERGSDLSWHAYSGDGENFGGAQIMGTPKKENSSRYMSGGGNSAATENQQVSPAPATQKILISEVQTTGGTGQTNNEFIELYNPNNAVFDLKGYRLVKRTKTGTADTTIKSWTTDAFVPAKGFYLWANSSYTGIVVTPDATTTVSIADDNGIAIRLGSEDTGTIIDSVGWGEAQNVFAEGAAFLTNTGANQSLERKALQNNSCVSAQSGGEFLGNGCDVNNNQNDFDLRGSPNPQSSKSFIEPRSAPSAVSNFNAEYASSTLGVSLSWSASADYLGSTSTTQYVLSYATSTGTALKELAILTATTTYKFTTAEVGLNYDFLISAKDKEGLASDSSTKTLSVPSQFTNFYFYKDTRTASSTKYLAEFYYNNYPLIQDLYWSPADSSWKILVFYLNKEAPKELELNAGNNWQPGNLSGVLDIVYANCASGNSNRFSLTLPDVESQCNSGGGVANNAFKFSNLEDPHILLELATTTAGITFAADDFITVGAYSLYDAGAGDQKFKLSTLDRDKYYFSTSTPTHQAPAMPENLELKVNSDSSLLRIIWDKGTLDGDTLDNLITFEINYSTTTLDDAGWGAVPNASQDPGEGSEINGRPFTKITVEPDNTYNIALRAKDDFGNVSSATTTIYFIPEISPPYGMSNIEWGHLNSSSTIEIGFNANAYPFMTANKTSAILFFLNQLPPAGYSFSNNAERWTIGGSNSVLKLQYNTCQSNNDGLLGGLLMHNDSSCPNGGSGLRKNSVRKDLTSGQTNFTTTVAGVLTSGGTESHTFSTGDYLTMGFYERNGSTFEEVSVYNKKIYFQP
ncbi:MAG: lamin tail domain-containing protein [Candidatus Harrisonbacteria bacterium]|nr:lamin tail domain-containing protein [Candidatus Harrisonbacteria bacterium]